MLQQDIIKLNHYSLEKAEPTLFAKYLLIYSDRGRNKFGIQSFDQTYQFYLNNIKQNPCCYWVKDQQQTIGGVSLKPNALYDFFIIPPFNNKQKVLSELTNLLKEYGTDLIHAYDIWEDEVDHYNQIGFKKRIQRQWMFKPTEQKQIHIPYHMDKPNPSQTEDIAKMIDQAYYNKPERNSNGLDGYQKDVESYFKHYITEETLASSTILYNENNEIIGACLICMVEGWPLIYEVAVLPNYQGQGLASMMIEYALASLEPHYPVLVLFVTLGNKAHELYQKLGFVTGATYEHLYLPLESKKE